jgi:uncharacterized protein YjbI with pentapeptide repeats
MYDADDPRCGRQIHTAPEGADEFPVCLMHSEDPRKQSEPLIDAFFAEFERTLETAGEGEAHFERFVFPGIDLSKWKLEAICRFNEATFTQDADFRGVIFTRDADFHGATFTQDAEFSEATFMQDADFGGATFTQDADFSGATFARDAKFHYATFTQDAKFSNVSFKQTAQFGTATFIQDALFSGASFMQNAVFFRARFKDSFFFEAAFTEAPLFVGGTFTGELNFNHAAFSRGANFSFATFKGRTRFLRAEFHGTANWEGGRFFDRAEFRQTKFEPTDEGEPSIVLALASFSKPGEIVFDDVDLSRALFHDCDVSQVWFTSSVRWGRRDDESGLAVIEETIPLEHEHATGLERDGMRDYGAVAQIYQQLKKNYDARLDYWTANEFHFGEMEMKRLAGPTSGQLLWVRRWWHRNLSFVAWYRYASNYGNSYRKPLLWLLGILFLSAALLPIPCIGLMRQGATQAETYASAWQAGDGWIPNLWAEARLAGNGAISSVDSATFQRNAEYTPAYPWGRVLAILETLLTSTLFGLFLLAIRRQFRR